MVDSTSLRKCEVLIALLGKDKVLLPGSTGYDASIASYFSPQAAAVHPACFVTPQSVADVSAVVKSLASANGSQSGQFAFRGGGHTWFADANSAPGGITIDLRGLNAVDLSADQSTISLGGGATWDAVYEKLDPLGLSVAGGRVSGVGVGGLTLGGGISYFGPREGWTCNQVTSFEVVLADGSVVEATSEKNADLWWGLRGGSHNFGIVTRMTLPTFEQGLLWYSMTLNPLSEVDNQARIYGELMAAENYNVNASFLTGWAYVGAQNLSVTLNQLIYTRPVGNDTPAVFQPVLDLPAISYSSTSSTVIGTALTLAKNSAAIQLPQAARYMTATSTFVPTEAMIRATYEAFQASLPLLQNVTGIMWAVNIEPLPPQLYTRNGADTNAFGLDNDGGSLAVFLISPSWSDGAQDEIVYGAARSLLADIEARAKALGVFHPYIYLNYAAPWQDPIASYGEASVAKLRALRKRVDPKEVFTRKLAGGFKIPEAA